MKKESVICPNCNRKIRSINAVHYCKEVSIDEVFAGKSEETILLFDRILAEIALWEEVDVSATKKCIIFFRNKTFLVLRPMSKCLEIKFFSQEFIEDDRLHKCEAWGGKYSGYLRLKHEKDLIPAYFKYFKTSYDIS